MTPASERRERRGSLGKGEVKKESQALRPLLDDPGAVCTWQAGALPPWLLDGGCTVGSLGASATGWMRRSCRHYIALGRTSRRTKMKVFSYVVMSDSGFAPNPFHGTCTLACCKAQIRRSAALIEVDAIMQVICKSSAKHAAYNEYEYDGH